MDWIFTFLHNFLMGTLIGLFYQKIKQEPVQNWLSFFALPFLFASQMTLTFLYIIEPFRTLSGMFAFGLLIWIWKRSLNWAALVLAFLLGYLAWIVSLLIGAGLGYALGIVETNLYWALHLLVESTVYIMLYKFIKLKNGIPAIEDNEIKGIIVAVTGIILTFFGAFHLVSSRLPEINVPLFYASMIALVLVVMALVLLIVHLSRRHKERVEAAEIKLSLDKLARRHHLYKEVIPTVGASYVALYELIDEAKSGLGKSKTIKSESIKMYLASIERISAELGNEFAIDGLKDAVRDLSLPDDWFPLEVRLLQVAAQCKEHKIAFFIRNLAPTKLWKTLPALQSDFIRLVGNLVGNAVKELGKMEDEGNQVLVSFLGESGVFVFEVRDTAHEFPVEILMRLGQRGNSTNGTGDGYAEVFAFLAKNNASLEITEEQDEDFNGKGIRIIFDGKARRVIRTTYRYELLQDALAGIGFEVEEWGID